MSTAADFNELLRMLRIEKPLMHNDVLMDIVCDTVQKYDVVSRDAHHLYSIRAALSRSFR